MKKTKAEQYNEQAWDYVRQAEAVMNNSKHPAVATGPIVLSLATLALFYQRERDRELGGRFSGGL